MSSSILTATIALQGAAVAASGELAVRSLSPKRNKLLIIRISKFILGFTMAVKTMFFLAFHSSIGDTACNITGRMADIFYHIAMTAGTAVLVFRVNSIIPIHWKRVSLIVHILMVVFRLLIGIVDTCVVTIGTFDDGTCDYDDPKYWGPVYTLYDTLIDLYVTFVISLILLSHIRSLALDDMRINIILYTSVIYHNVIRSVLLTIVNLISAIFIITKYTNDYIMLVWPIINIVFVVLVGYDSDVTKAIRKLQQMRWQRNSNNNVYNQASTAQPVIKEREVSFTKETTIENQSCSQSLHTEKYSLEVYEEKASQSIPAKSTRNTSYDTDSTRIET